MDGIETLRALKEINPELQVILLTGHGNLQSGIEAMKLGAMDFLEKPTDFEQLLDRIQGSVRCRHAFNGLNVRPIHRQGQRQAAQNRFPVDQDGTGPALAVTATIFGPR